MKARLKFEVSFYIPKDKTIKSKDQAYIRIEDRDYIYREVYELHPFDIPDIFTVSQNPDGIHLRNYAYISCLYGPYLDIGNPDAVIFEAFASFDATGDRLMGETIAEIRKYLYDRGWITRDLCAHSYNKTMSEAIEKAKL